MFVEFKDRIMSSEGVGGSLLKTFQIESSGDLTVNYAPFDYINTNAKIAIFGITPGAHQAGVALDIARNELLKGQSDIDALRLAKQAASFSGSMRNNLVEILDHVGVNNLLEISSSSELFQPDSTLAHFNSALRYPVFIKDKNYSGRTPKMVGHRLLKKMIDDMLVDELKQLGEKTLLIPLGTSVEEVLMYAVDKAGLPNHLVVRGLPHPSGANIERIRYFLGQKARKDLSVKVNPEKIDEGRELALSSIDAMRRAA